MPTLSIPNSFTPYTKIRSADVNANFTAVSTLLNTTKLDDTNLQTNGLTRIGATSKLKAGTVKAILINDSTLGNMAELAPVVSSAVYFDSTSTPTAGALPLLAGGTGVALALTTAGDVLQVNASASAMTLSTAPTPPPVKVFNFYRFS